MTPFQKVKHKIGDWNTTQSKIQKWQKEGLTVVFTNGCFDIVHYGHIHYLAASKAEGHKLVVAMNAESSIRKLKGATRPIHDTISRLHIMASFEFVDAVVEFSEETPLELLQTLRPNVLVKGGDYIPENIVGYDLIKSLGGEVKVLPFVEGYSTSKLEEKMKKGS